MLGEKETHKYLGILEADTIKQAEIKEKKIKKEYLKRTRKLPETKLYSRNFIKRINTWTVSFIRYSRPFLVNKKRSFKVKNSFPKKACIIEWLVPKVH